MPLRALAALVAAYVCLAGCRGVEEEQPAASSSLGFRAGAGLFDAEQFHEAESWLGVPIRYTVQFSGRNSPEQMRRSSYGLLAADSAELPELADRVDLVLQVPLGFGRVNAKSEPGREEVRANLNGVASGEHDAAYRKVAEHLKTAGFPDAIIRLGHEFNGRWAPWSSVGNEAEFIEAYRHVHGVFREVSADFRFDWTGMRADWESLGPPAYPGDAFVDIVGVDVYWKSSSRGGGWSAETWESEYRPVLDAVGAFAQEHGKSVSVPEWAVQGSDVPEFIDAMVAWMNSLPAAGPGRLEYHAYFNTTDEFRLDRFPRAETAFFNHFGAA